MHPPSDLLAGALLRRCAEAATTAAGSAADIATGTASKAIDLAISDVTASQSELESLSTAFNRGIRQRQAELKQATAAIASLGVTLAVSHRPMLSACSFSS
jgi:exonuclease VII large subunit